MTTRLSGTLRLLMAAAVALTPIVAGFLHRSPGIVVLLAPVFTVLYATGKWASWRLAWRTGGIGTMAAAVAVTLPIQALVAGMLYLVGLGLGALVAPGPTVALSRADALTALLLFVGGLAPAVVIIRLEEEGATAPSAPLHAPDEVELSIDPAPLTPQSFFLSPGYWRTNV